MRFSAHAALLILVATLTSCTRTDGQVQSKASDATPALPAVPAVRVERGSITNSIVLTAEFQPFQEVDVMAKVAGYVRSISVDLGDTVRQGQTLAELEIPEMMDELSKAAAIVEQTGSEIGAARDELQRAESAHQIAHLSFMRVQEVAKKEPGLIPAQEVDEARSRDQVAEAQVAAAQSKLRVEENKTRVAKAEENRLKTLRNYVTITAPFAGTVTKRYAHLGSMIQAGTASQSQAMPLVRLSQLSVLRLSLPVPESFVPSVRLGEPVAARVKSLGQTFQGRVARFASKVDPSTRTMITEVDVANRNGVILPGMYAEVQLQLTHRDRILVAPLEAIERGGSNTSAYIVDSDGAIRVVPVKLGVEDAARVEIVSGLRESDVIITGRRTGLSAGDRVAPKIVDSNQ